MKLITLAATAVAISTVAALPVQSRTDANLDITILQFALTLEHLENAFYVEALNKLSADQFTSAGLPSTYYNNLKFLIHDEQSHVKVLSDAITAAGATPVSPCEYTFPYTDVASFITLSSVLEGVGTSAYLGGAPLITSKDYLKVAGSILVTEALHTSFQRGSVPEVPFANPYGTALDPNSVFTLAASFITSCPSSNVALPFKAFPTLTYDPTKSCNDKKSRRGEKTDWTSEYPSEHSDHPSCSAPSAGDSISLTAANPIPSGSYVTVVSGLDIVSVQGSISDNCITVTIPDVAQGQTYFFITNGDNEKTLSDSAILFGPAIVEVTPPPPTVDLSI